MQVSLQFFSFTNSNEKTGPLGERARLVLEILLLLNLDVLLNVFRRDVERFGQLVTLEIVKLMTIAGVFVEPVGLHLLR